jgi:hypothetical protein
MPPGNASRCGKKARSTTSARAASRQRREDFAAMHSALHPSKREFDATFTRIVQAGAGALVVIGSPFFTSNSQTLVALSARHAIPTIYDLRDYVAAGGLISYSASFTDNGASSSRS